MAIGSIGSTGSVGSQTVGGVGGDTSTKIQDLLNMLQSGSGASPSRTNTGTCPNCQGGGCANCAAKASGQAKKIGG